MRGVDVQDVVVIGAGQAGLSAAYGLARTGLDFTVLDGEVGPGGAWRHRWDSLRLSDAHRVHPLPGMDFAPEDASRPANRVVPEYFAAYEREFALPVVRPVRVSAVRSVGELLRVETDRGDWTAKALVNATGTWNRPFVPHYPGVETFRGRQLHTVDFPGAEAFAGQRVVVVGGGSSAVQFLLQIAPVAAATTWVTRTPPRWRSGPFDENAGREAVALVEERVRQGLPPRAVVSVTGLPLTDANRAGIESGVLERRPMFTAVTPTGVRWGEHEEPADVLLWATGFRPAVGHLAPLHPRSPHGGIALDGTRAVADPRAHLVGYGPSASTIGANRAGRAAAREIAAFLTGSAAAPGAA
ncbi:Predicted flavoprotein CzcO associated with the cation diffusion facilitator CzcD [Pseudonocardia oroxyli]|uniref:Predicted flavoprotein CzcO associated with the cation diffusion facilitator CzcD n=1 Tax=Pseudonocardia oroxyli TaxID=366584 RepID=A0A1G7VYC5_PSEOR|nr:Predicted flavoprotein CzcO associated with the cation diffusion facilitator CzcD [Pseudonocardia oroxyli]